MHPLAGFNEKEGIIVLCKASPGRCLKSRKSRKPVEADFKLKTSRNAVVLVRRDSSFH
jgi:hypothetical protein